MAGPSGTRRGWKFDRANGRLAAVYNDTEVFDFDANDMGVSVDIVSSGGILSTSATDGIGYTTGAGGSVTQITSAATGVTINKVCGAITTVALTTAAAAEERFTVTNSTVGSSDVIALSTSYDGAGTPILGVQKMAFNAFDIVITNVHAANALNDVMVINFVVIQGG